MLHTHWSKPAINYSYISILMKDQTHRKQFHDLVIRMMDGSPMDPPCGEVEMIITNEFERLQGLVHTLNQVNKHPSIFGTKTPKIVVTDNRKPD